ncbi:MAG TPA: ATP-binding protein, partial [Ramlibacter sp.]|uniref:ATP-binding protein n=1 Tax=Ramlibacter sp. TaxID=1917967 RepID=UPI002D073E9F
MSSIHNFMAGGGEMGARMRAHDWAGTPLGAIEQWPQSLRSAVSIMLPSKAQICMFWGPELTFLYNDAYRPVLGSKHPAAMGLPISHVWSELWDVGLKDLFDGVLNTGEAFRAEAFPFFLERHGYAEETYFDISYDPVRDESGRVGGVFCIVSEKTGRVIGERRLRTLRDLGRVASQAQSTSEAFRKAAEVLGGNPLDLPFALLCAAEGDSVPRPMACCGLDEPMPPSLKEHLAECTAFTVLPARAIGNAVAAAAPWPDPVREVVAVPLATAGEGRGSWLVCGISARRALDDDYRDFIQMVASSIGAAVDNARRSEDERRRAEQLAELDRAKTAFFSNVSHEFRTPLTLLMGPVADALADSTRPLPEVHRERLEMVQRSALRLHKLVNSLLDFSRVEAGRAQANYVATDLGAFTAELASTFRSAMDKAGLRFVVDSPACEEPAFVDRDLWEKIVLNLLSNAFKFTFEGEVAIRLRRVDAGFELNVRDTGVGIPEDALPRMFERFHRVEGARSRTHEGSGIGLALVQELARLHGGHASVESVQGAGSCFTVTIPAGVAHLDPARIGRAPGLTRTAVGAAAFVEEALRWLPGEPAPAPAPAPA